MAMGTRLEWHPISACDVQVSIHIDIMIKMGTNLGWRITSSEQGGREPINKKSNI